ncbi:MAG TPA: methionyl-tRNA formyltransferase [Steroidobacteraceae bacterium]
MTALRIAFAGTPEFALPVLQALATSRHQVVGVLTQPDRPRGRGRHSAPSPVKLAAQARNLPLSQPLELTSAADRAQLESWRPELLVVVAYGLLLPPAVLELPRLGCLNIHASLLPRWRGAAPIQRAILAGDVRTGVTIMQMDRGLDTGPLLSQHVEAIGSQDTSRTLQERLARLGAIALLHDIEALAVSGASSMPQGTSGVTLAPKIRKSEALIAWESDAAAIDRRVRAFDPWPIAETRLAGEQLRIHRARVLDRPTAQTPGTVVEVAKSEVVVSCGRDCLALIQVQRAGRRPIAAVELARSHPLLGLRLG